MAATVERSIEYWRWECNSTTKTCQRTVWKYSNSGQSLRTCQMTCGPIPLWPQPNGEIILSNKSVSFSVTNVRLLPINAASNSVRNALESVCRIFFKELRSDQALNHVTIQTDVNFLYISIHVVANASGMDFRLGTDESYKLTIQHTDRVVRVSIKSATYFGARHALETLRQLTWYDKVGGCLRIISHANVVDSPSFLYRGLLLDTANHYIPVHAIKQTISAMAVVKMNVFHWHMTGSTSFPFAFQNKEHVIYGAYSSKEIYTDIDIRDVIGHAKFKGIKVLIEFDNPSGMGQGWSWGGRKNLGDLNICNKNKYGRCEGINYCNNLNPNNKNSYRLLRGVLQAIKNITGFSDVSHLGGSVDIQCWIDSPKITDMDVYKRKGVLGVLKYHQTTVYNIMTDIYRDQSLSLILWSDYFKKYNDPTKTIDSRIYIAQITSESTEEDEKILTDKGYRVIISHADKWDMSRLPQWNVVYDHRPWEQLLWSQRQQVLGGEALLWTHLVDQRSLHSVIWPALAALAEVLWTDPQIENLADATLRLQLLRDRLVEREIAAAAITPKWCSQNPGACL